MSTELQDAPENRTHWKRCSSCKAELGFAATHWVCSVSTCTRKRTGMVFCSVSCWEVHLPMMRHREAFAVEARAPGKDAWLHELREEQAGDEDEPATSTRRRVPVTAPATASRGNDDVEREILVVASKLKKYIRARSGMNTSDTVLPVLSDHLRALCNAAIRSAGQDGRKTVMDRDLPPPVDDEG